MQQEDVIITKGHYRGGGGKIQNEIQSRMSPSSHAGHGKQSHSPRHWKKYLVSETNVQSPRRQSNGNMSNHNGETMLSFADRELRRNKASDSRNSLVQNQIQVNKMNEQKRRKEQMMKRVQQIQKKVMPILKSHRNTQQIDENYVWHNRIEQRILKLETNIDMMEKQAQLKLQRRLIEVQKQWKAKFQSLLEQYSGNRKQYTANGSKNDKNEHYNEQYDQNQHQSHPSINKNGKNNHMKAVNSHQDEQNLIDQDLGQEHKHEHEGGDQGYFTRRENWMGGGEDEQEQQVKMENLGVIKKYSKVNKK